MGQGHSYRNLLYHLIFATRDRQPLIRGPAEERALLGFLQKKATDLESAIEGFGAWDDHAHVLLSCGVRIAISDVYGQLKGFSSHAWNLRFRGCPRFGWSPGVYVATVDPDRNQELRGYIRNQRTHHGNRQLVDHWEPPCAPRSGRQPAGLAAGLIASAFKPWRS